MKIFHEPRLYTTFGICRRKYGIFTEIAREKV